MILSFQTKETRLLRVLDLGRGSKKNNNKRVGLKYSRTKGKSRLTDSGGVLKVS